MRARASGFHLVIHAYINVEPHYAPPTGFSSTPFLQRRRLLGYDETLSGMWSVERGGGGKERRVTGKMIWGPRGCLLVMGGQPLSPAVEARMMIGLNAGLRIPIVVENRLLRRPQSHSRGVRAEGGAPPQEDRTWAKGSTSTKCALAATFPRRTPQPRSPRRGTPQSTFPPTRPLDTALVCFSEMWGGGGQPLQKYKKN